MSSGDKKSVNMGADGAYGPRNPRLVQIIARDRVLFDIKLAVGTALQASDNDGKTLRLMVVALDDHNVTLDAIHRLAGEARSFCRSRWGSSISR